MHTEYQQAAARTMPSTSIDRLPNWALGLCGEAAEQAVARQTDEYLLESGDILWHCHAILTALRIDANAVLSDNAELPEGNCMYLACQVAELTKKHVYHFKPLNTSRVVTLLRQIVKRVESDCMLRAAVPLIEVYRMNIEKLQARWPDGFAPEGVR